MKFGGYSWWIAVILGLKIGGCGTIRDYDGFELGCSSLPESRLGLGGAGAQQESSDCYSYSEANSHKFCVIKEIVG